jgi:hypothetical protein
MMRRPGRRTRPRRGRNTASSAVLVLPVADEGLPYMWWTPAPPCTGVYLPAFVNAGRAPEGFGTAGSARHRMRRPEDALVDTYYERSYWWRFQRLLDLVKGDEQEAETCDTGRLATQSRGGCPASPASRRTPERWSSMALSRRERRALREVERVLSPEDPPASSPPAR